MGPHSRDIIAPQLPATALAYPTSHSRGFSDNALYHGRALRSWRFRGSPRAKFRRCTATRRGGRENLPLSFLSCCCSATICLGRVLQPRIYAHYLAVSIPPTSPPTSRFDSPFDSGSSGLALHCCYVWVSGVPSQINSITIPSAWVSRRRTSTHRLHREARIHATTSIPRPLRVPATTRLLHQRLHLSPSRRVL